MFWQRKQKTVARYEFVSEERIHYLQNLMEKQLQLYGWCEAKVTTLATINSILVAGVAIFLERVKSHEFPQRTCNSIKTCIQYAIESHYGAVTVGLVLLPVSISLALALYHVIPKMQSGVYISQIGNHRSVAGILRYNSMESYKKRLDAISEDEIYHDLVHQIFGMSRNIWRSQLSIRRAVYGDIIALIGFIGTSLYLSLA